MPTLFPWLDLRMAGFPVAFIKMPNGFWEFFKIRPIYGGYFVVKYDKDTGGIFKVDATKRLAYRKAAMYLYHHGSGKPFSPDLLVELQKFCKGNSISKMTRKYYNQGRDLRRVLHRGKDINAEIMKELIEEGNVRQVSLDERIQELLAGTDGESGVPLHPIMQEGIAESVIDDSPLIKALYEEGHMDKAQAIAFIEQLATGRITPKMFLEEARRLHIVEISEPMTVELETLLDDFHNYYPAEVYQFIMLKTRRDKSFEKLASPVLKPTKFSVGVIVSLFMMLIIGYVVITSTDASTLESYFPQFSGEGSSNPFGSLFGRIPWPGSG